ncbi:MAG: hypothetical protein QE285_18620 [Aquabacterium sp.]|nr:hypothetical protein [Aquabacterium sp.]
MKSPLDTNISSHLMKRAPLSVAQRIDALPDDKHPCLSFRTWAELLKGAARQRPAEDTTLISNNLQGFERIAGLRLANWADA